MHLIEPTNPILHSVTRAVEESEFGAELALFGEELKETMLKERGVGLAAPQIGDTRSIVVVWVNQTAIVMVNPIITSRSKLTNLDKEGCLSYPNKFKSVSRPRQVTVTWRTPTGEERSGQFSGFSARIVQHELDHLAGKTIF